jgi:hypothetical protein
MKKILAFAAVVALASSLGDSQPTPAFASTYHNHSLLARALSINAHGSQSLRLAQATPDCLKYCQATYPCGNNDINTPQCSKLKACLESCG